MTHGLDRSALSGDLNAASAGYLPGLLGIAFTSAGDGWIEAGLAIRQAVMAPNGFLHAGTVVTLADSCCGHGCMRTLPDGAAGFTTVELKSNFLGTAREGFIDCRAEIAHRGRSTQLWDAKVTHRETGKTLALFRCTQMILWPR